MDWLWLGLHHALAMFWALVPGFSSSGVLQVFVSKEQINRAFGQTNLKSVSLATGLGAASSSCSYTAVATRSAIRKARRSFQLSGYVRLYQYGDRARGGALGLMRWPFVLEEIFGALGLIILMWLLIRLFLPKTLEA